MWPLRKKKKTARQKEIQRGKVERRSTWYRQLAERVHPKPLLLLTFCAAAAAVIVNAGHDVLNLHVGQRVTRAITSRIAFRIEDEQRTQIERMRARDNAEEFYTLDTSLVTDIRGRLASALPVARQQLDSPDKVREGAAAIKVLLDDEGLAELIRIANLEDATIYERAVERGAEVLERQPLVKAREQGRRRTGINAVLVNPTNPAQPIERKVTVGQLLFANQRDSVVKVAETVAREFPLALRPSIERSLLDMLAAEGDEAFRALYLYDQKASAEAALRAERSVPPQYVEYAVDSRLADAGLLTRDELELLQKEHLRYLAVLNTDPGMLNSHRLALAARALMAFVVVFAIGGYIILRHEVRRGRAQPQVVTALALLLMLIVGRASYLYASSPYIAVGAQAFAMALLAITSRRTAAQATGALLALMIALATRQGIGFLVVLAAVSVVLALGLRDVRNRGRIIAVGSLAALVALGTTMLVGLVEGQQLGFVFWNRAFWAALATLAAAFIVEGILPGVERLFGVTTNMTLLEWCDPNKPLLRMLAAESPGTYNHSLLVGALAGSAADAIGANGLLARAGAYYHDIGKINKPEYFVENQGMGVGNRHDRLSPAMSHLIIIGHVKDGVEMAKAYGLPASLHAFIPEHHGTCVIEYFYHAASQARKPGDPEISDTQFRYPGPKPQSRETAICMLCDAVEGAVRAMPEPTPGRIEDTVERMIQKRLGDGQFDECDLTFRELAIIRSSLVKSLISLYHGRITYPSDKPGEVRSA